MPTISVAFVVYGIHAPNGKLVDKHIRDNPQYFHKPIDIRRILWNDPAQRTRYKCSRGVNATDVSTQIAMLDDRRFYEACVKVYKIVEEEAKVTGMISKVIPVHCTAGDHRSHSVVEAVVNRVLNAANTAGERRYNAKAFLANSCHKNSVIEVVCDAAVRWLINPFCLREPSNWGSEVADVHARAYIQLSWLDSLKNLIETDDTDSTVQDLIDPYSYLPFEPFETDDKPRTPSPRDKRSTRVKGHARSSTERRGSFQTRTRSPRLSKSKQPQTSKSERRHSPRQRSRSSSYWRRSKAVKKRAPWERSRNADVQIQAEQDEYKWTGDLKQRTGETVDNEDEYVQCPCCGGTGVINKS